MAQLVNIANVAGDYLDFGVTDTTQLSVELSALSVKKSADKHIWLEDQLTYTISIENVDIRDPDDPDEPGAPVTSIVLTDIIEPKIATLLTNTLVVTVGGVVVDNPNYTYDAQTGMFTLNLDSLSAREEAVCTFQVDKVQP